MVRVPLSVSVTLGLKTMVDPAANVSAAPEATVKLPVKRYLDSTRCRSARGSRCRKRGCREEVDILEALIIGQQRHIGGGDVQGESKILFVRSPALRTLPEARTMLDHAKRLPEAMRCPPELIWREELP